MAAEESQRIVLNSNRYFVFSGGLCGAAGVALSAAAAHSSGEPNLGIAANMLLFHAPAFLAIGLMGGKKALRLGGLTLLLGLLVFAGDLLTRVYLGARLFPMAAPSGGVLMIGGWLGVAAAALARPSGR